MTNKLLEYKRKNFEKITFQVLGKDAEVLFEDDALLRPLEATSIFDLPQNFKMSSDDLDSIKEFMPTLENILLTSIVCVDDMNKPYWNNSREMWDCVDMNDFMSTMQAIFDTLGVAGDIEDEITSDPLDER